MILALLLMQAKLTLTSPEPVGEVSKPPTYVTEPVTKQVPWCEVGWHLQQWHYYIGVSIDDHMPDTFNGYEDAYDASKYFQSIPMHPDRCVPDKKKDVSGTGNVTGDPVTAVPWLKLKGDDSWSTGGNVITEGVTTNSGTLAVFNPTGSNFYPPAAATDYKEYPIGHGYYFSWKVGIYRHQKPAPCVTSLHHPCQKRGVR